MNDITISPMVTCDIAGVRVIESERFEFPWTRQDFAGFVRDKKAKCFIAEHGEAVVGYVVTVVGKRRIELHNIAVAKQLERRGIGSLLIDRIKGMLGDSGLQTITAAVRESNLTAQKFLRKHGFAVKEIRRGFYDDSPESAYIMVYVIDPEDCRRAIKAVCDLTTMAMA